MLAIAMNTRGKATAVKARPERLQPANGDKKISASSSLLPAASVLPAIICQCAEIQIKMARAKRVKAGSFRTQVYPRLPK
jgi:hypothetical protein